MKKVIVAIMIGILLVLMGATVASAASPDAIYIDRNAESPRDKVTILRDDINNGRPDIWIKRNDTWAQPNAQYIVCPECDSEASKGSSECPSCGGSL